MNSPQATPHRFGPDGIHPLTTLDPSAAPDDLDWLDDAIGDARVVAIGESSHYNAEYFALRTRILRYLAERHGFTAFAMESGYPEGLRANAWVRDGESELDIVLATGVTSLFGLWTPMRDHLEWMRSHNLAGGRLDWVGVDLPGSQASPLPGLDAVTEYLTRAEPDHRPDPDLRAAIAEFAATSPLTAPQAIGGYAGLPAERKDAITAGLARLAARFAALRIDYIRRTSADEYARARRILANTIALDGMIREMASGDPSAIHSSIRDAAIADTVEEVLAGHDRIVFAAHNGHVQKSPFTFPGIGTSISAGAQLADRLGDDYLAIGTTSGTGKVLNTDPRFYTGEFFADLAAPEADSLDAVMSAGHDGRYAADLRRLSDPDRAAVASVGRQRISSMYAELEPLRAFDILAHLPEVTPAVPDPVVAAHMPSEVRDAVAYYLGG